jgi:predicted regulator of Ras-like GTPase activity (Roadblock/LC7/MglB family)
MTAVPIVVIVAEPLPDNATAGTIVADVSVLMSDASAFSGALTASPAGTVTISGNNLVLARGLTSADDGLHQWSVAATENGVTVLASIQVQVLPTPRGITFTPTAASLPDNAAAGTTVAAVSVSMSNGSTFSGTLAANPTGTVAISGNNLVLARALTWRMTVRTSGPLLLRKTALPLRWPFRWLWRLLQLTSSRR